MEDTNLRLIDRQAQLLSVFIEEVVPPEVMISGNGGRSEVHQGPALLSVLREKLPIAGSGMVECWHSLVRKVLLSASNAPSALAPSVALSVLSAWLGASNQTGGALDQIHRDWFPEEGTHLPNGGRAVPDSMSEERRDRVVVAAEKTGQRIAKAILEALPPERQALLPPVPVIATAFLQQFVSTPLHGTTIRSLISWGDESREIMGLIPYGVAQQPTGIVSIPIMTMTQSPIPFRFGLLGPSTSSILGPVLATDLRTLAELRAVNANHPNLAHSQAVLLSNLIARSRAALSAARSEELLTNSERFYLDSAVAALSRAALLDTSGSRSVLAPRVAFPITPFPAPMGELFEGTSFSGSVNLLEKHLAAWEQIPRETRKKLAVVAASLSDIDHALAQLQETRSAEPLQVLHWHFFATSMLEARTREDQAGSLLRELLAAYVALRTPFDVAFVESAGTIATETLTGLLSVFREPSSLST
jgi:hypothetical protein